MSRYYFIRSYDKLNYCEIEWICKTIKEEPVLLELLNGDIEVLIVMDTQIDKSFCCFMSRYGIIRYADHTLSQDLYDKIHSESSKYARYVSGLGIPIKNLCQIHEIRDTIQTELLKHYIG